MVRRKDRYLERLFRKSEMKDEGQNKDEKGSRGAHQDGMHEFEEYDLLTFMEASGFEEDELFAVIWELDAYKSIPGTTLLRYVNRVQGSIGTDCRPAFLKGVIVGTAIWENLVVDGADLERRIDEEVKRRLRWIIEDLNGSDADPTRDRQFGERR
jgi:hypothetical protein